MNKAVQLLQLQLVRDGYNKECAKDDDKIAIGATKCGGADMEFLFVRNQFLVREEFVAAVRDTLQRLFLFPRVGPDDDWRDGEPPAPDEPVPDRPAQEAQGDDARPRPPDPDRFFAPVIAGLRIVRIDLRDDRGDELAGYDELATVRLLRDGGSVRVRDQYADRPRWRLERVAGLGHGALSLNTVVHLSPGAGGGCPAVEPDPVPEGSAPDPGYTTDRCAGEGVKVVVLDTGLDPTAAQRSPWLTGVTGDPDTNIRPPAAAGAPFPDLVGYAGHGTFIAGLIRAVAPRAEVHVRSVLCFGGGVKETDLVKALDEAMDCDHPDIISMSAGTYAFDTTGPLTFQVFYERRLRHHKGVAFVAAAGNDADRKWFWPAAAPYTVSVGALASTGRGRAGFSNFGGWVDVYAPGQDLVNAFPAGKYTYREPPREGTTADFHGMARWSGTSFSTPIVAGLIAARMSQTGENGRDAAAALLKKARKRAQPGVGAVLLPE